MQIKGKSFKVQLILSLISFAVLSILISVILFLAIDRIYKNRISAEIESNTEVISQSIDNFFKVPDEYLAGIRDHIDEVHINPEAQDENCIIVDVIDFIKTFESVYLLDQNGMVLNTWPYNENYLEIDMSNHDYFKNTLNQDTVYWSETFFSQKTGQPTVALSIKCKKGLVVAYYNLAQLNDFISFDLPSDEDFIAVLDANGNVIAHTDSNHAVITGNLNNMPSIKAVKEDRFGIYEDYYQNARGLASVKKGKDSGFTVLVFKSYDHIFQDFYKVYALFPSIIAAVTVLFIIIILLFFRNFLKPMENLQNTVKLVASGNYATLPKSKFIEFELLTRNFTIMVQRIKRREAALKTSINERETLLRELSHRTKNNMQLITGFMSLYHSANPNADPLGVINIIQSKIETISLVHDKLYSSSDLSSINLKEYIEDLVPTILNSSPYPLKKIDYAVNVEDIYLLLDYAVPCGLILNEFIINSLKYAFIAVNQGRIEISGKIIDEVSLEISYSDNGTGLPPSFEIAKNDSLGLSIVNDIIKSQLHGNLKILPEDGFSCKFSFNLDTYSNRI